jgi:hypothetical protein
MFSALHLRSTLRLLGPSVSGIHCRLNYALKMWRTGRKVGCSEEPQSKEERIERGKGLVFEDAVLVSPSGLSCSFQR